MCDPPKRDPKIIIKVRKRFAEEALTEHVRYIASRPILHLKPKPIPKHEESAKKQGQGG
jgi:hypothetical protein